MFDLPAVDWSTKSRGGSRHPARRGGRHHRAPPGDLRHQPHQPRATPFAVGAYIAAAYFFTSSTSFANPAVTVGRMFSDTFAGIAPERVPAFVVVQLVGGAIGLALIVALFRTVDAADVVVPHPSESS